MFSLPDLKRLRRKWPRLPFGDAGAGGSSGGVADAEVLTRPAEPVGPPVTRPRPTLLGYLGERSTRHVAGWIHNPADPTEHAEFEVVCTLPGSERVLTRGRADQFHRILSLLAMGDATYWFRVMLPEPVSEAERDHIEVRPIATGVALQLDPNLRTRWEPIRFVAMDIVDNCNLRCPFCVYDYSAVHTTNVMSDEVYDAALKLLPLVGPEQFWLSCLHEPTLHPRFVEFITRLPREYRSNVFYTSNFARRMPAIYYDTLAESGLGHINVSIESRDPAIYERMRKGARFRIFMESWDKLLAACSSGSAPPRLQYIIMAYQSNLREIPELVEYLRNERLAANIAVRHTFDMRHIPGDFKASEYLGDADWRWLQAQLAQYPIQEVMLAPPPGFRATPDGEPDAPETAAAEPAMSGSATAARSERLEGIFEVRLSYDGSMAVCPALAGESPQGRRDHVHVNVTEIGDPADFLMSL